MCNKLDRIPTLAQRSLNYVEHHCDGMCETCLRIDVPRAQWLVNIVGFYMGHHDGPQRGWNTSNQDGHRVNNVTKEWLRLINYQIYQRICCPKVINPGKSPWCGWYDGYDGYFLCLNWRFPTRRDFRRRCYWFLMMGCGDPHCHVSLPEATIKLPILGWNPTHVCWFRPLNSFA